MPGTERRIVVGVDGSAASQRALDWGIAEAQRVGASLHLVTAWMFPMALGYAFTTTVQRGAAERPGRDRPRHWPTSPRWPVTSP